jgi:hypothetical protein
MATFTVGGREFASQEAFVTGGRRCGTPTLNEFQKARVRSHLQGLRAAGAGAESAAVLKASVGINFHVISDGAVGDVAQPVLDQQVVVLNNSFSKHGITFKTLTVDRTSNATWFRMTMGSGAERKAKTALHRNTDRELNFYTAGIGAGLLGWATFPSDFAGDPVRDGVVILFSSLPGGASAPYNLGITAVHEIGHWLGLYHTFEGGCTPPGDEVDDTPFEASPNFGAANPTRDTCPQPGLDPTTNYMDYTDDVGMTEFTSGQITRIKEQLMLYRPLLLKPLAPPSVTETAAVGAAYTVDMETGAF